ncbi:hypothetical protein MKW98_025274 [Papaver atlanticum]|uniref:Uncharacterized protein n=1 Tax=Papaver atlanticum TaxID=357466 RepID=A0AAD4S2V7_9MAGN|nr:hypothetical protein MKW98_025274 [Papaver atlanticum]
MCTTNWKDDGVFNANSHEKFFCRTRRLKRIHDRSLQSTVEDQLSVLKSLSIKWKSLRESDSRVERCRAERQEVQWFKRRHHFFDAIISVGIGELGRIRNGCEPNIRICSY